MDNIHELTRAIYKKQHERIASDIEAFDRIRQMYSEKMFGIDPEWFNGKIALDAGCGNVGALMLSLYNIGCKFICGIDIGDEWIYPLENRLKENNMPESSFELKEGSVLGIPYQDESFDFVAMNGVLLHLKNMDEVLLGFEEGVRVTKKNGYFFTSFGPCQGLIQGVIFPAIREHYKNNKKFKDFIDNIHPGLIHECIDKIAKDSEYFGVEGIDPDFLKELFGEDFCVFLQNFIQAPTWLSNECTPTIIESLYRAHGFNEIRRIHNFVKRKDIRKFFATLHYDIEYPISKILYGQGYVQFIGRKR